VGGRGSAFCVLVEKVDIGRGEGGDAVVVMVPGRVGVVVEEDTGLRVGSLSVPGIGRRRLRMEDAAGIGCCCS
jgi:hypothetical protein